MGARGAPHVQVTQGLTTDHDKEGTSEVNSISTSDIIWEGSLAILWASAVASLGWHAVKTGYAFLTRNRRDS